MASVAAAGAASIAPVSASRITLPPAAEASISAAQRARPWLKRLAIATAALAAVAAGLMTFVWPRTGALAVTVAGPNRAPVEMVEIRVDDRTVCQQSPCAVTGLKVGAHTVDVTAPGYVKSATRAAEIEVDQTAEVDFSLTLATTGVRVGALGPNLRLFVDGKDRGPLPARVDDVGAGSHSIRIEGNEHYQPFEQQLTLGPGEIKTLEPKLRVVKGLARLERGENLRGAHVWLVCGNHPKAELALPTVQEVAVEQGCRIEASKRGFENANLALSFEDGSAEKSFTVGLARTAPPTTTPPVVARPSGVAARSFTRPAAVQPTVAKAKPPPLPAKPAAIAGPQGTIKINSMPVSSVTVDGTPAGQTPTRVSVAAGRHTVVFTHPEKGRKSVTINVRAGASTGAVVKFD
jgi:hypothetical protein